VQSGIEIGKLLTAKKKRDTELKRKQEKEKKKAKKEAKKQVWYPQWRIKKHLKLQKFFWNESSHLRISTFSIYWQKKAVRHLSNGTLSLNELETNERKVSAGLSGQSQGNGPALSLTETSTNRLSKGQVNWAYQHDTTTLDSDSDTGCPSDGSINKVSHHGDEEQGLACGSDTHSIILDIATTSFVDTVTVNTLKNVCVLTLVPWNPLIFC